MKTGCTTLDLTCSTSPTILTHAYARRTFGKRPQLPTQEASTCRTLEGTVPRFGLLCRTLGMASRQCHTGRALKSDAGTVPQDLIRRMVSVRGCSSCILSRLIWTSKLSALERRKTRLSRTKMCDELPGTSCTASGLLLNTIISHLAKATVCSSRNASSKKSDTLSASPNCVCPKKGPLYRCKDYTGHRDAPTDGPF